MSFLNPYFLFSLFAILIPIIIHLFNFRLYKTVYFSNVRFLKNIKQETKSKSEIKHLLILICRILIISCIVFAFAQPYIPISKSVKIADDEIVSIYIDNSFSMDAESKYGKLLEVAKNKASNIADAFPTNTRFLLITNDFEPRHQTFINREQLLQNISEIRTTPVFRKFSEVISHYRDFISNHNSQKNNTLFTLSDIQKSAFDFNSIKIDSTFKLYLMPLTTQSTNNLYIDSCWFESPSRKLNIAETIYVKIINRSDEAYQNIPVNLFINDSLKGMASFSVQENSSEIIPITFTNAQKGICNGKIELTDYPITYDNSFFFSYLIADSIQVLSINEAKENQYFNALFANDAYIKLINKNSTSISTHDFANYQVIVLNEIKSISSGLIQELINFTENGGTLLFFPNISGDVSTYNSMLNLLKINTITQIDTVKCLIDKANFQNEIYANVFKRMEENTDMPYVYKRFNFSSLANIDEEKILSTTKDEKILSIAKYGKGKVYISAIPLDEKCSNLVKHLLFVPTFYNIALQSQISPNIYYTIGQTQTIEINYSKVNEANLYHIVNQARNFDFIPQQIPDGVGANCKLYVQDNIKNSGNYLIINQQQAIFGVSFNYNRNESDLRYYSENEIKTESSKYKNMFLIQTDNRFITKTLRQINQGTQLWKLFIILSLFFILIEILLARFWFSIIGLFRKSN